jgi:cytochrome c-type biogenesis protein CcmE
VIPAAALVVVLVVLLVNLSSNLVFFRTPTEVIEEATVGTERMRVGGQVVVGSVVVTTEGGSDVVSFEVTDGREAIAVLHSGAPQELFSEGIGVVIEGTWDGAVFHSDTMLVKHDEQYRTEDGVYELGDSGSAAP